MVYNMALAKSNSTRKLADQKMPTNGIYIKQVAVLKLLHRRHVNTISFQSSYYKNKLSQLTEDRIKKL